MAENSDYKIILSAFIEEIVLNGLKTRKTLNDDKEEF